MRISGGAVSVADVTDRTARDLGFVRPFWLNEIRAGRAFANGTVTGPSVGNNSHVQLFNPAASGITAIVHGILAHIGAQGILSFRSHSVALTADAGAGVNLNIGGLAGACHIRTQNNAGVLGTNIQLVGAQANEMLLPLRDWWAELGEGEGVLIAPNTVNVEIGGNFEWIEV